LRGRPRGGGAGAGTMPSEPGRVLDKVQELLTIGHCCPVKK
jgi:hypothetical protein